MGARRNMSWQLISEKVKVLSISIKMFHHFINVTIAAQRSAGTNTFPSSGCIWIRFEIHLNFFIFSLSLNLN